MEALEAQEGEEVIEEDVVLDIFNSPDIPPAVGRAYIDGVVLLFDVNDQPDWARDLLHQKLKGDVNADAV